GAACARGQGARLCAPALLRPARWESPMVTALLWRASGHDRPLSHHLHSDGDARDRLCLFPDPQGCGVAARPLYGLAQFRGDPDVPDRPAQSGRRNPCSRGCEHPNRVTARGTPPQRTFDMQSENRIFDHFATMMNGIAGTVAGAARAAEAAMRERAKEWIGRMDFVSREEFEAVKQMAATARAEAEALKARLDKLEGATAPSAASRAAARPAARKPKAP